MPIRLHIHLIHATEPNVLNSDLAFLTAQISESFASIAASSRKFAPLSLENVSTTFSRELPPSLSAQELDLWIANSITSKAPSSSRSGQYSLVIIVDPSISKPAATIGSHRHAWIRIPSIDAIQSLRPVFDSQLQHLLVNDISLDSLRRKSYRFTFSLLNEDPSSTIPTWNFSTLFNSTCFEWKALLPYFFGSISPKLCVIALDDIRGMVLRPLCRPFWRPSVHLFSRAFQSWNDHNWYHSL